ncbi:uncharacterized protein CBL_10336 [Carabus blaptoides fortunei]
MNVDGWESSEESPPVFQAEFRNSKYKHRSYDNYKPNNRYQEPKDHGGEAFSSWGMQSEAAGTNYQKKNNYGRPRFDANDPCVQMEVPSHMVGKIIGRGGAKINELQSDSGARIVVTKEESNGMVVVKLHGAEEVTNKAKELIEDVIGLRRTDMIEKQPEQAPIDLIDINWKELSEENDKLMKEMWAKLPPLKKDFYVEDEEVKHFSKERVQSIRSENNNIVVSRVFAEKKGYKPIANPVVTFEQCFRNYPEIMQEIRKMGFEQPSPIQCQAWPVLLSGDDLIGIAQTGTGKTLAFLLPALIHIEGQPQPRRERTGPSVLVMAPTRELALQIEREVNKYQYKGIKAVCVYGGGNRREQVDIVTRGVEIVIATPGRLCDLTLAGHIKLKSITYLVLDEADRMLDMGFEPQIRKVLIDIRPDRQTVMTSATWPVGVRRLAESYMDNPVQVYVGSLDLAAVHSVVQTVLILEDSEAEKFRTLFEWLRTMDENDKAIVFCGKKALADHVASELVMRLIPCQSIHGDREQCDREQALEDITDGTVKILVATDVASRGLDIQDITHVINFDFPRNIEEYVHRVGRTGRAGRTGESISYFTRADWSYAKDLIAILDEANQHIPDELYAMSKRYDAWKERKQQDGSRGNRFGGGNRNFSGGRGRGAGGGRW